ncbi:hypothetical protein, partial [Ochrobactrum sp. SFR4]|uniref:hypothetical protein n=1 Tax=Ochrobactrum sp. SFR4 TaxID=2717368 RepID=UPI001C8CB3A0
KKSRSNAVVTGSLTGGVIRRRTMLSPVIYNKNNMIKSLSDRMIHVALQEQAKPPSLGKLKQRI